MLTCGCEQPARGWDDRRQSYGQGGQLTQYNQNYNSQQRRSTTDVDYYQGGGSRRSRSRGKSARKVVFGSSPKTC